MDKVPLAKKSSRLGFPFFCCFDTNRQCAKKKQAGPKKDPDDPELFGSYKNCVKLQSLEREKHRLKNLQNIC